MATKSAGSFVPTLSLYYTKLRFKIEDFDETAHIYTTALSPSYFHNFIVKKKFFASLGLAPGVGIEYVDGDTSALYQVEMTLALGYNSDTFLPELIPMQSILQAIQVQMYSGEITLPEAKFISDTVLSHQKVDRNCQ